MEYLMGMRAKIIQLLHVLIIVISHIYLRLSYTSLILVKLMKLRLLVWQIRHLLRITKSTYWICNKQMRMCILFKNIKMKSTLNSNPAKCADKSCVSASNAPYILMHNYLDVKSMWLIIMKEGRMYRLYTMQVIYLWRIMWC